MKPNYISNLFTNLYHYTFIYYTLHPKIKILAMSRRSKVFTSRVTAAHHLLEQWRRQPYMSDAWSKELLKDAPELLFQLSYFPDCGEKLSLDGAFSQEEQQTYFLHKQDFIFVRMLFWRFHWCPLLDIFR